MHDAVSVPSWCRIHGCEMPTAVQPHTHHWRKCHGQCQPRTGTVSGTSQLPTKVLLPTSFWRVNGRLRATATATARTPGRTTVRAVGAASLDYELRARLLQGLLKLGLGA